MTWYLFIVFLIVALIAAMWYGYQSNQKLLQEGVIIKRDYNFVEQSHRFQTKVAFLDFYNEFITHQVEKRGISYEGSKQGFLNFKGAEGWEARIFTKKQEEGQPYEYVFLITKWKTHKGMTLGYQNMNALLTAIEKSFLALDSKTRITRVEEKTKTKSSFF